MVCMFIMLGHSKTGMAEFNLLPEETQTKWLTRLGALVMPDRISRWHER
jgi:hypothetical protein